MVLALQAEQKRGSTQTSSLQEEAVYLYRLRLRELLRFHVARRLGLSLLVAWPLCLRPLYFLPALVRPRSSRCLCTGFAIQLMRGSCSSEMMQHDVGSMGL